MCSSVNASLIALVHGKVRSCLKAHTLGAQLKNNRISYNLTWRAESAPPPWETFLNNSKTAQDIKMEFFKFNIKPMGVIFHIMTILINLRCCRGNRLFWLCRRIENWRNLHICQDISLILLKFGAGEYFWILNPKSTIKFLYDVILTSKWCESKIPIYHLQEMRITSLWCHLLSNFYENVNLSSSCNGLSPHQIWFNLDQGNRSYWNIMK